jgi:hypothetical protein
MTSNAGEERIVDHISIEVDRDGWTGQLQLSIRDNNVDGNGREVAGGGGYRLAGPKFNGSSKRVLSARIGHVEARQIRRYLDKIPPCTHGRLVLVTDEAEDMFCLDCHTGGHQPPDPTSNDKQP